MPNIRSAKKRLRQTAKKTLRNTIAKTRIKTETKKALAGGDAKTAFGAIDRAAAKGIIHRNAAARRKSRLAKKLAATATP
jgi:small subunit ribosomal protein S20